jgi:hypothetical protein
MTHERKSNRLKVVLACSLLLPLGVAGQSKSIGVVKPNGDITVNGSPISQTTPLFAGDVIRSGAGATAIISQPGSITPVPEGSIAAVNADAVRIASACPPGGHVSPKKPKKPKKNCPQVRSPCPRVSGTVTAGF